MKIYHLTIVFDEDTDTIEYIEEEMTEDTKTAMYKISVDPDYYDEEVLKRILEDGIIAEC